MAFTCDNCHKQQTGKIITDCHFSFSMGSCEFCGEFTVCADCHCKPNPDRKTHPLLDLSFIEQDGAFGVGYKHIEQKWYGWKKEYDQIQFFAMDAEFIKQQRKPGESDQQCALRFTRDGFDNLPPVAITSNQ